MFVLNQAEADVGIAILAEADAGGDGDLGLAEQLLGEFQGTQFAVGFRDRRPGEHGGLGLVHMPAGGGQALAQDVAAALILAADLAQTVLGTLQGGDGGDLDGGEGAIVQVGLDTGQGTDQVGVAAHEADAPTGHVVALGQGKEFDGDLGGPGDLEDGGGDVAIEDDVGVGQVVDHPDAVLPGDGDDPLEEVELDALGGGIAGEVDHQHLGLGPGILDGPAQLGEEVDAGDQGHMADVGPGDDEAVGVNGVSRIGHQDGVARAHGGEGQVGQPLLGADGDDGLLVRVQIDLKALAIPVADGAAQAGDAAGDRVTMGVATLGGLQQLVDDMPGGGLIGVAHAEVDDVLAPGPGGGLQLIDDVEDIGR